MGSLENIANKQWQIRATMSNSVLLRNVLTVRDIAKKVKADKIKGIVRKRPLRPADPWIMDLAMKAIKDYIAIYGSKLISISIIPEKIR